MLAALERPRDYANYTVQRRIKEIQLLLTEPGLVDTMRNDFKHTKIIFTMIEIVRISLAKHELRKNQTAHVQTPTIGYMNRYCGSLEYEINNGGAILGKLSRRDIADYLRDIPNLPVPSEDELSSFEAAMRGPKEELIG